jgi:nucleoside-diphosphate-sugar epimerase
VRAIVTGATGFIGGALARRLLADGHGVVALGRDAEKGAALREAGATFVPLDLIDAPGVADAFEGGDVVFHCAALSSPWGRNEAFRLANVVATENVVAASLARGVRRLVHVSTPSIYFSGRDRLNVAEDAPLPRTQTNAYAATKLLAEGVVDRAVADGGLSATTIRPRAVFGPGDNAILPRLVDALERGRLPLVGAADNLTDVTYVDNVVDALLLCADAPDAFSGRKYNVTNGEPMRMWDLVRELCERLDLRYPTRRLPAPVVRSAAAAMEAAYGTFAPDTEPLLTRYTAGVLSYSTTLDITAIRRDLGYEPRVSVAEGIDRFVAAWRRGER